MSFLFKVVAVGLFNAMLTITWLSLKGKHQLGHFLFNPRMGPFKPLNYEARGDSRAKVPQTQ